MDSVFLTCETGQNTSTPLRRVRLTVHVILTQFWSTEDGIFQSVLFPLWRKMFSRDGKSCRDQTKSGCAVWKEADFFHLCCGLCGRPTVDACRLTGNNSGPPSSLFNPSPYNLAKARTRHSTGSSWTVYKDPQSIASFPACRLEAIIVLLKRLLGNNKLHNTGRSWATWCV